MDDRPKLSDILNACEDTSAPGALPEASAAWKRASADERRDALDDLLMDALLADALGDNARSRRRARWTVPLVACAAAVLLAAGIWWLGPFRGGEPAAEVSGDFTAFSPGGERVPADAFARGFAIEAGADGARMALRGRFDLTLKPGARLTWLGDASAEVIALDRGTLGSKVVPGRGRFTVRTPCGELTALGTEFMTTVEYPAGPEERMGATKDMNAWKKSAQVTVLVISGAVAYQFNGLEGRLNAGTTGYFGASAAAEEAPKAPAPAEAPRPPAAPVDPSRASEITLDVKDVPLSAALAEFAKQSGNHPIFAEAADAAKKVTVKFDKTPYWEALDGLLTPLGLTYQADPNAADLTLAAAPAGGVKTSYAGPVVFKLSSIAATGEADGAWAGGKLKCTVEFFWEDRLAPTAFTPVKVEKLTDAAGNPCELPRGLSVTVGGMHTSGGFSVGRLEVMGGAFWGKFSFLTPRPAAKGDVFAEISGAFGLVTSAGKIELRIDNPLGEGEKSVERDGYKLTITKVELHETTAILTTEFTRDGNPVALPWPGRGGWSLVDADGTTTEGKLMGGCMVIVPLPAQIKGGLTLVRVYSPDAADVTYLFKFEKAPIAK